VPVSAPQADFGEILDRSSASDAETTLFQAEPEQQDEITPLEKAEPVEIEEPGQEDAQDDTSSFDSTVFELPQTASEELFTEKSDNDAADIEFPVEDDAPNSPAIEFQTDPGEVDFGGFDFGDAAAPVEEHDDVSSTFDFGKVAETKVQRAVVAQKEYGGLDFTGDDMFGEVVAPAPEEASEAISFDLGMDGFADAMKNGDGAGNQNGSTNGSDASADAPFTMDEIDFGDDLTAVAIQQVNPEELKPSQDILFSPLAAAQARPELDAVAVSPGSTPSASPQDLPPLSIASRRKQGPISTALLAVIGIVVLGALAFFGYSVSSGDKEKSVQEAGRISVREVDATFVKNSIAGDLLVISGKVVNEYSTPRAAIQVKGMVYGADGQVIASKNAFCGNPLTSQQLAAMPQDKIEAAMANQFGDSLANMDVAPGKIIPFVIVMAKPDKAARDYGVEVAGSTVAAGKQQ
jgi:hypothetical protein